MIIDVNTWTGPWPALVNVPCDVLSVRASLREYGVERIFMAPLAAVWSANPHLCNSVVYEAADKIKAKGGKILREAGPGNGGTSTLAFVEDPDGYPIELLGPRGSK